MTQSSCKRDTKSKNHPSVKLAPVRVFSCKHPLIADDMIDKVEKPTSWVSPVVITPKRFVNEIRLNVDMREANKAIPREHTVMPTHDLMTSYMNTMVPQYFRTWIWTMAINSWNWKRTAVTSPRLQTIYRYKRLNFGTRPSGEIFQDTVSKEITPDIPWCINISNDILVFCKSP